MESHSIILNTGLR